MFIQKDPEKMHSDLLAELFDVAAKPSRSTLVHIQQDTPVAALPLRVKQVPKLSLL
jgi:hypothetical protein